MAGFFDFNFGDIAGPLVNAGSVLAGGFFQQGAAEDIAKQNIKNEQALLNQKHQQELETIRLRAALSGAGGGGGGAGPFLGFTDPQKVQAIQNQNQVYLDALNNLIAAYQGALRGGR